MKTKKSLFTVVVCTVCSLFVPLTGMGGRNQEMTNRMSSIIDLALNEEFETGQVPVSTDIDQEERRVFPKASDEKSEYKGALSYMAFRAAVTKLGSDRQRTPEALLSYLLNITNEEIRLNENQMKRIGEIIVGQIDAQARDQNLDKKTIDGFMRWHVTEPRKLLAASIYGYRRAAEIIQKTYDENIDGVKAAVDAEAGYFSWFWENMELVFD